MSQFAFHGNIVNKNQGNVHFGDKGKPNAINSSKFIFNGDVYNGLEAVTKEQLAAMFNGREYDPRSQFTTDELNLARSSGSVERANVNVNTTNKLKTNVKP
ncbi:MAG: hypothetical protein FWE05_05935 [Defluviitaleaceae bacterium]|nr:hypothetical protein [Defluviitaleaceae bacterium]